MGGPGCVIMIAEDGRSYQFYGPELNNLNYYRELDEIEHIEEYGVLLVNDSVEGTAFMIDALFHPSLKNVSGMNERELKIAREIQEEIIKYLSDEEGE